MSDHAVNCNISEKLSDVCSCGASPAADRPMDDTFRLLQSLQCLFDYFSDKWEPKILGALSEREQILVRDFGWFVLRESGEARERAATALRQAAAKGREQMRERIASEIFDHNAAEWGRSKQGVVAKLLSDTLSQLASDIRALPTEDEP